MRKMRGGYFPFPLAFVGSASRNGIAGPIICRPVGTVLREFASLTQPFGSLKSDFPLL